jgi:predicted phage baseplate assembly protein
VRQVAPAAFRTPERAVTPEDYARMAERHPQVQRAQATVRWTGSWRTVFLTVDRAGGLPVDAAFEADLRRFLERWRLAGHDLEIDEPRWVPVEVEVFACVDPGYFRADVERAIRTVLGNRQLPDGRRGLFHPDNFTFGQSVYLSRVYAAAQGVAGVSWAEVRVFRRQDDPASNGIPTGEIPVRRLEVARLDDDPSHPDRGTLRLGLKGGR